MPKAAEPLWSLSMHIFSAPVNMNRGANAPTCEYAAFAYSTALNARLADRDHVCRVGALPMILFWAEGGNTAYQDCAAFLCLVLDGTALLSGARSVERIASAGKRKAH